MLTTNHRRLLTVLTCLALTSPVAVLVAQTTDQNAKDNAKQGEAKRPKISVRAQPPVGVAPFRVVLTGELQGRGRFRGVLLSDRRVGVGRRHHFRVDTRLRTLPGGQEPNQTAIHRRTHVSTGRPVQGLLSLEAKRQTGCISIGHRSSAAWGPRRKLAA